MSAIAGMVNWRGAPAGPAVRKAIAALALHGRDGENVWDGGDVALGWRQTVLHEEDYADRQPLSGGGGRLYLVFDGRIDNRADLASLLAFQPEQARQLPDSSYVLAAFEKWGEECLMHLLGDFAFAIWNSESRQLFLARDHFGKKPLVYFSNDHFFFFASMPSALFTHSEVPCEISRDALLHAVMGHNSLSGKEFYREIIHVPSAHFVSVSCTNNRICSYWRLENAPDIRFCKDDDYAEACRTIFNSAVGSCLRTIHPVGSHLSSGRDSSSVTAVAARLLAKRDQSITAFTHIPPENWKAAFSLPHMIYDEGPLAATVAAKYANIEHVLITGSGEWNFDSLDAYMDAYELLRWDVCNAGWYDALHHNARQRGIRVMLTGMNGNLTISYGGTDLPATLLRRGQWKALWSEVTGLRTSGRPFLSIASTLFSPFLSDSIWRAIQKARNGLDMRSLTLDFVNPSLVVERKLGWKAKESELGPSNVHRATRREVMEYRSWSFDYNRIFGGALAAWDVELRDPTADLRLVEFCFGIPDDQFARNGVSKWLLSRTMKGILPEELLREKGRGRQSADWPENALKFRQHLAKEIELAVQDSSVAEMINISRMKALLKDWDPVKIHYNSKINSLYLRFLYIIEILHFIRRFNERGRH
jgi:asparagine synthase (glutamine-hydrolysing)